MYVAAQIVKQLAMIMAPFIPFTAEKLWQLLNLEGSIHKQNWNQNNQELPAGHKINTPKLLFRKIEENEEELQAKVEKVRAELKKVKT